MLLVFYKICGGGVGGVGGNKHRWVLREKLMIFVNSVGFALRSFPTLVFEYNRPVSEYQFPNIAL